MARMRGSRSRQPAEDDGVDGHALAPLVVPGDIGHHGQAGGEARVLLAPQVGVGPRAPMVGGTVGDELVPPVAPAGDVVRVVGGLALPPQLPGLLVAGDVDEQGAGALGDRPHGVGVGLPVGVLGHPEGPVLGVHAVDAPVGLVHAQPHDVVAVELDLVALAQGGRRAHHGQVRLARGRGHAAADVVGAAGDPVADADEHELLAHEPARGPAVVGGLAQAVGDLAQQGVAAVGRAEVQDRALVGDGGEQPPVVGGALPHGVEVPGGVDGAHEEAGVVQAVEVARPHAGHAQHLQDDDAVVGELDADGPAGQRRAGRGHEVGHDVHGPARHGAAHALDLLGAHLIGVAPVVVHAPVGGVVGGHDRALLGAGGVPGVGVGQVAVAARLDDLPGLQGLGEQALVGVGVDDLDAVGGEDAGPLGDEFVDMGVGQTGPREDRGGVRHGGSNRRAGPRGRRRRPGPEGPCGEHRRKFAYAKLWELHVETL